MADENIARSNKPRNDLTAEFVRSVLDYDPATGVLSWKRRPARHGNRNNPYAGKSITCDNGMGYIQLTISCRRYKAHRVIWLMMTNAWPAAQIDHISGIKSDNRWTNLREATHAENQHNRGAPRTNTSGYTGVWWGARDNKWIARIKLNGKDKYLGSFVNVEDASRVYQRAAAELFGSFHRGRGAET